MQNASSEAQVPAGFTPFAYGFRPFFLAAGVYAFLALGAWLVIFHHGLAPFAGTLPQLWHGHEMLFGFIVSAIAGFLLTSVPSWTGARGFGGRPLILLFSLWVAGRLALSFASALPWWLVAAAELTFLPALIALLAPPLVRAQNRNTPLLLVLAAFWAADAAMIYGFVRGDVALARHALYFAIHLVMLLVTIIGGRIVPAFTANALRRRGIAAEVRSTPWLEKFTIGAMIAVVVVGLLTPESGLAALVAGVAAAAQLARLARWQGLKTLDEPIVWVLHVAYGWLPIGLALKAVWIGFRLPWAAHWLHALTVGVAALMILAVTTRASLGHTGRPLVVAKPIALAYVLLALAALVRVFAPALVPEAYVATVLAAGLLWLAAFGIYVVVYSPILLRARIDGRPG